ncbi:MAG: response regulator, partial [Atribacterota bacterium]
MNKKSLNILILEDNPDDAELVIAELEKEGYIINWDRVDTQEDFAKSLRTTPDLILADYKLPSFNALDALKIKQEISPAIPLIIISGTIGEEVAV